MITWEDLYDVIKQLPDLPIRCLPKTVKVESIIGTCQHRESSSTTITRDEALVRCGQCGSVAVISTINKARCTCWSYHYFCPNCGNATHE